MLARQMLVGELALLRTRSGFCLAVFLSCLSGNASADDCVTRTAGAEPTTSTLRTALPIPSPLSDPSANETSDEFRTRQVIGAFDGTESDPTSVTAASVVVITLMRDGVDVDRCNGLHYTRGLVATNAHCFNQTYDALYVDFGTLARAPATDGTPASPDYIGEYRCRATRHPYRPANAAKVDVAVVKLNAVPSAFGEATVPFDPDGSSGETQRKVDALLVNYWLDPDLTVSFRGTVTQAFRLRKYDIRPPHCHIDWEDRPDLRNPCLPRYQVRHDCDTTSQSSGAPLFGARSSTNGDTPVPLVAIALNANGVPDRSNCAVPAAAFARELPK